MLHGSNTAALSVAHKGDGQRNPETQTLLSKCRHLQLFCKVLYLNSKHLIHTDTVKQVSYLVTAVFVRLGRFLKDRGTCKLHLIS